MISYLHLFLILSQGVLAPADPGVLERVAERRITWDQSFSDWREYDVLIAVANCNHLGRTGWVITPSHIYSTKVVDCEQQKHKGQMAARYILADINTPIEDDNLAYIVLNAP